MALDLAHLPERKKFAVFDWIMNFLENWKPEQIYNLIVIFHMVQWCMGMVNDEKYEFNMNAGWMKKQTVVATTTPLQTDLCSWTRLNLN